MEYENSILKKTIRDEYYNRYGKMPTQSLDRVIDCVDSAFLEEYWKERVNAEEKLLAEMDAKQKETKDLIEILQKEIKLCTEIWIKDERTADAMKAYQSIVSMSFDTPQQKLQNIQNASYFIWALYASGSDSTNTFFNSEKATNVKEESDMLEAFKDLELY